MCGSAEPRRLSTMDTRRRRASVVLRLLSSNSLSTLLLLSPFSVDVLFGSVAEVLVSYVANMRLAWWNGNTPCFGV